MNSNKHRTLSRFQPWGMNNSVCWGRDWTQGKERNRGRVSKGCIGWMWRQRGGGMKGGRGKEGVRIVESGWRRRKDLMRRSGEEEERYSDRGGSYI